MGWVDAFKIGAMLVHPKHKPRTIELSDAERMVQNFRDISNKGYRVPVLNGHGRKDPYIYGRVDDVRIKDGYFQTKVKWTREKERQAFKEGLIAEFSPGLAMNWIDPHAAETRKDVILEMSFTPRAYQRNLRDPLDINDPMTLSGEELLHLTHSGDVAVVSHTGGTMTEENQSVEEPQAEETPAVEATEEEATSDFNLREKLEGLEALVAGLVDQLKPKEVALTDDQTRIQNLEAEVDTLKADKVRLELSAKGIPADRVEGLVALSAKVDADEFAQIVEYSQPTTVQEEIGSTGAPEMGSAAITATEIVELARQEGIEYGTGELTPWLHSNGYGERVEEVRNVARR